MIRKDKINLRRLLVLLIFEARWHGLYTKSAGWCKGLIILNVSFSDDINGLFDNCDRKLCSTHHAVPINIEMV
jgi:hypothetical protein